MSNRYVGLGDLKADINIDNANSDAVLLRILEDMSRAIDAFCGRHFYSQTATRVYEGGGGEWLWIPDDVLSVTTLKIDKDGDGTYEVTLAADTDYWTWPDNSFPKVRIDLNPKSTLATAWPSGRRRIQVAGTFGYSDEGESAGTLGAAVADATTTTVTMASGHSVEAGDTITLGSEQLDVIAVAVNTLTVQRGINGTTAAAHADAASVSRRRYPRDVERATLMRAGRIFQRREAGYANVLANPSEVGVVQTFRALDPETLAMLQPYRRMVVA